MRARLLLSVAILIAVIAVSSMLSNVYAVSVASDEYVFDLSLVIMALVMDNLNILLA